MKRWRFLVQADDGSWNNFIYGACWEASTACAQQVLFQRLMPQRRIAVVPSP